MSENAFIVEILIQFILFWTLGDRAANLHFFIFFRDVWSQGWTHSLSCMTSDKQPTDGDFAVRNNKKKQLCSKK